MDTLAAVSSLARFWRLQGLIFDKFGQFGDLIFIRAPMRNIAPWSLLYYLCIRNGEILQGFPILRILEGCVVCHVLVVRNNTFTKL